ncbi:hypothetical protein SSX86_010180 [Deinandra increscens subsp. villosa]|uniref:non-specific serine/threonine protein kinase n=1 Tax=Deinandra increscens subsp. villosa TaxID=3103831 RepID=A0AAP0D7I9_9ASTR
MQANEEGQQVNILGQLAHPNIIRLLGCCNHEDEQLLVYEYMPNKSLDRLLFANARDTGEPLSWGTRVLIMIGVARGLTYLHSRNLILRDLKCSHILLDEEFNAKLGGFSLARYGPETEETHVSTSVMGTSGLAAPEYITTGHLSMKCDIYMFGVVLLESISSRRAMDLNPRYENLVVHVSEVELNRRNVKEIMDQRLGHNYPLQGALECVALAFKCLLKKPRDRPSTEEVLESLEQIYTLYE